MTIKIAYRTEEDTSFDSVRHIAEAVTPTGERLRYTHMVPNSALARDGELIQAHAKRYALHSLVDDAIHKGLFMNREGWDDLKPTIVAKQRHLGFAIEAGLMVAEEREFFRVTYFDGEKVHTAECTVSEDAVRNNQSHEAFRAMCLGKAFEELALHLANKASGVAQ